MPFRPVDREIPYVVPEYMQDAQKTDFLLQLIFDLDKNNPF